MCVATLSIKINYILMLSKLKLDLSIITKLTKEKERKDIQYNVANTIHFSFSNIY